MIIPRVLPSRLFFLFGILLIVSACARNPVTGKQELMLISEEQEIAMGEQSKAGAIAQYGIYDDGPLQAYFSEKGMAMAKISHRPTLEWEFYIMDSPVVNAFAAPGGFIFFTRGILAHFNNEAQFMGVLGHEIGHVTARHSASQMSKQLATQVGLVAGMVISPELAQMGDLLGQGAQLLFYKFSRDDESQSDRLGVEYSSRLGYDAEEMADFFTTLQRLQDQGGGSIPTFLSTHPDPADRNQTVDRLADEWRARLNLDPANLTINRDGYLKRLEGMVYGENPRQGFFEGDVFYHPELKFQFPVPAGWQKLNTPTQVLMVTENQDAGIILKLAEGTNPRQAAQKEVENYGLSTVDGGATTVNGLDAYYLVGDLSDQNSSQVLRVLIYNIAYGDLVYQFLGFSQRASYDNYDDTFLRTMRNFDRLTDADKLNRQPERMVIRELPRDMAFTEAMSAFGVPSARYEEMAILNGMDTRQSLPAGSWVKIAR